MSCWINRVWGYFNNKFRLRYYMTMRWSVRIHPFMYKFPFTVILLFYRKLHFVGWYLGCPLLRHRGELEPSRRWRENSAPPQDRTRWLVWSEAARRGVTYPLNSILWHRSVWVWTSFPFAMSSIIWLVTIALYGRNSAYSFDLFRQCFGITRQDITARKSCPETFHYFLSAIPYYWRWLLSYWVFSFELCKSKRFNLKLGPT